MRRIAFVNEKGGVLGRRVELVVEDDQSEPAAAARIYQKLIGQDKVDAILGPYSSPLTEAVADLAEEQGAGICGEPAALEIGDDGLGPESGKVDGLVVTLCHSGGLAFGGVWSSLIHILQYVRPPRN